MSSRTHNIPINHSSVGMADTKVLHTVKQKHQDSTVNSKNESASLCFVTMRQRAVTGRIDTYLITTPALLLGGVWGKDHPTSKSS